MRRAGLLLALWLSASGVTAQPTVPDWRAWKDLTAAIAIAPLDGPDELLEKAEIIADRVDALARARRDLSARCTAIDLGLARIESQLEVLLDFAATRGSRVVEMRQQLHSLRSRRQELRGRAKTCAATLAELDATLTRRRDQHTDYLRRVDAARRDELQERP